MNNQGLVYIIIGAIFEAFWAYGLKHADSPWLWVMTITSIILSFYLFTLSLKHITTSIAYVVYTGLGTLFIVVSDMATTLLQGGSLHYLRIVFVFSLMTGVIILKSAK